MRSHRSGFSLLELVLSLTLLGFAVTAALVLLRNQVAGNLESDTQLVGYRLQDAQARAIAGLSGSSWGVHFDNSTTTTPFYAVFPGTSYGGASTTYYLSGLVQFSAPVSGSTTDIVFTKLTGTANGTTSIVLILRSDASSTKTITVTGQGQITIQ